MQCSVTLLHVYVGIMWLTYRKVHKTKTHRSKGYHKANTHVATVGPEGEYCEHQRNSLHAPSQSCLFFPNKGSYNTCFSWKLYLSNIFTNYYSLNTLVYRSGAFVTGFFCSQHYNCESHSFC